MIMERYGWLLGLALWVAMVIISVRWDTQTALDFMTSAVEILF